MAPYGPVWSCVILYVLMALYGPLWPRKVPYGPVWPCMVQYGPVGSWMVPDSLVWSHMVPYGSVWCRMVLHIFHGPVVPHLYDRYFWLCSTHATSAQILCLFLLCSILVFQVQACNMEFSCQYGSTIVSPSVALLISLSVNVVYGYKNVPWRGRFFFEIVQKILVDCHAISLI